MLIFSLVGNSLEIGCMTKIGVLGGEFEKSFQILQFISGKKLSFQVKSRLYLGLIGVKWSQYATYFHLGPIQG